MIYELLVHYPWAVARFLECDKNSTYILVILLHDQVILANLWLNLNLNFKRFLSVV